LLGRDDRGSREQGSREKMSIRSRLGEALRNPTSISYTCRFQNREKPVSSKQGTVNTGRRGKIRDWEIWRKYIEMA
jgi:hypothetical protein